MKLYRIYPISSALFSILFLLALAEKAKGQASEKKVREHILFLASDQLEGRAPGTKGEKMAAEYISSQFKKYGLKKKGSKGYSQHFHYTERPHAHHKDGNGTQRKGQNILGFLDNGATRTMVIGAHYDHLGHEDGRGSSLEADPTGKIHNGADDNASGVAGLLELARIFTENDTKEPVNFLFMAFSAEEAGLIGSKYFLEHPTIPLKKISCMFNMDMIGRLRDSTQSLSVGGAATSPVWIPMTKQLNRDFRLVFDSAGLGPSDHASFYLKDIPVLHFFSGTHSDYHKASDDAEKINFAGEVKIINYIKRIADSTTMLDSIPFTKTKSSEKKVSAFKVTLGIMADYAFGGPGVKVDGVSPGKAAEKAGLMAGDLIMKIGEWEIKDIYSYMEVLGKFSKGQKTTAQILRGGLSLEKEVVF
jgi:hypothetical protein